MARNTACLVDGVAPDIGAVVAVVCRTVGPGIAAAGVVAAGIVVVGFADSK